MTDAVEWILGSLSIVLIGVAFALGGHVIREAWREALRPMLPTPSRPATAWGRTWAGIATAATDRGQRLRRHGDKE